MPRQKVPWQGPAFLEPHQGRWVAIAEQEVLVHGESPGQVRAKLKLLHWTADDVILVPGGDPRWVET